MKEKIFLMVVLLSMAFVGCVGCVGYTGKISQDGSVSAIGIFAPSPGEQARAQYFNSLAAINYKTAEQIGAPSISSSSVNNDNGEVGQREFVYNPLSAPQTNRSQQAYVIVENKSHRPIEAEIPEYPEPYPVAARSFFPIPVSQMPETITIYRENRRPSTKVPPYKPQLYRGLHALFVIRIDDV